MTRGSARREATNPETADNPAPAFVLSADWHVCRSAWQHPRGIEGDSYFALRQVVDLAVELGVPLLAAGDLFDSTTPHPSDVAFVRRQMLRMRRAGLDVFYVQGQHERTTAGVPWLAACCGWPRHASRLGVDVGPFNVYGLDWQPAGRLQEELAAIDDPEQYDFLLAHQVWQDLMGGHDGACEGKFSDVPGQMSILTGDFHASLQKEFGPPGGIVSRDLLCHQSRVAYSPGAIHRLAIDEPDVHWVLVFNADGTHRKSRIRGRACIRFDVAGADDFDDLLANRLAFFEDGAAEYAADKDLPRELHTPLLRVRYPDSIPDAAARLAAAAAGKFHLFAAPVAVGTPAADVRGTVAAIAAAGIPAALAAYDLSSFEDPDGLRADCLRLLTAPGRVEDEIDALCEERRATPAAGIDDA